MKIRTILLIYILLIQSLVSFAQWTLIPSGTKKELLSVHFPCNNIGYIVGREATLLKTMDGGNLWNQVSTGLTWELFESVYFINDTVGFITGSTNGKLLKTIDGGNSWSTKTLPTTNDLNDIKFINDSVGLIVGYREIWKTTDQGNTWVSQYENQKLNFPVFYSVEFLNADTIFIAGVDANLGRVLKTTDGGKNWMSTSFSETMRFDVKFINDSVGYNVGSNSDIYKTIDGGANWSLIADPGILNNKKLFFLNDSVGYSVGYEGHILSTTDGGLNWTNDNTNTINDLHWIDFINENTGFVVGDTGTILKFKQEVVTSIEDTRNDKELLQVFPNPASKSINIIAGNIQMHDAQITLVNNLGEVVYNEKLYNIQGVVDKILPTFHLTNGLYHIVLQTSTSRQHKIILISH